MPTIRDYGRTNRTVSIFGTEVGLGIVMITYPTIDQSTVGYSAEGEMIASATGRKGGEVVITVLPGSDADKRFARAAKQFSNGDGVTDDNGAVLSDGITLTDTINNVDNEETITSTGGVFVRSALGIEIAEGIPSNLEYAFEFQKVERSLT